MPRWLHPDGPARDGVLDADEPDVPGPDEGLDGRALAAADAVGDGGDCYAEPPLRSHCKRASQRSRKLGGKGELGWTRQLLKSGSFNGVFCFVLLFGRQLSDRCAKSP